MLVNCEKCEEFNSCNAYWTKEERAKYLCIECRKTYFPDAILWENLIETAPDLLQACQFLMELIREGNPSAQKTLMVMEIARKAIDKAKG